MLGDISDNFRDISNLCHKWLQRWTSETRSQASQEAHQLYELLERGPTRSQRAYEEGLKKFGQDFERGDEISRASIVKAKRRIEEKLHDVLSIAAARPTIGEFDFYALESIARRVDDECAGTFRLLLERMETSADRRQLTLRTGRNSRTSSDSAASPSSSSFHARGYTYSKSPLASGMSPRSQLLEQFVASPMLAQSPISEQNTRSYGLVGSSAMSTPTSAVRTPTGLSDAILAEGARQTSNYQPALLRSKQSPDSTETKGHYSPGMPSSRHSAHANTSASASEKNVPDSTPKTQSCPEKIHPSIDLVKDSRPDKTSAYRRSQTAVGFSERRTYNNHKPSDIRTESNKYSTSPYSAVPFATEMSAGPRDLHFPSSAVDTTKGYQFFQDQHLSPNNVPSPRLVDSTRIAQLSHLKRPDASFCDTAMKLQNDPVANWQTLFSSNRSGPNHECRSCGLLVPKQGFRIAKRSKWEVSARFLAKCHAANPSGGPALLRCALCKSMETFRRRNELWAHIESHHDEQDFHTDIDIESEEKRPTSFSSVKSDRSI